MESVEDLEAFWKFLGKRQPPRPISEGTADDVIEFLLSLPSHRINRAVRNLSGATMTEVKAFLKELVKTEISDKEYVEKNLNNLSLPGISNNLFGMLGKFVTSSYIRHDASNTHEPSRTAVRNPTSPATSDRTLELRDKLKESETPFQQILPEHSIPVYDPVIVISCGDNQDSEEAYFISYLFNELCLRSFAPLRYDLTRSTLNGNLEILNRSQIGIVIISMNYTFSRESMDGFMAIMDHLKANDLVLIPVFFKVSHSDVRGQSGSFGREFSLLGNSVQASQILKWRESMIELTSINKYHQYMTGDKVMLAKNIVRDVCSLLNSETNRKLVGTRLQLKSILSRLHCSQSSAPLIVGIWGMAGIGKTTMAREIFRTQAEKYDVCYFLPNFDMMCQTKGMNHLRDEFFSRIFGKENVFIDACDTKISFTRDWFLDKRVLIVLDGVSNARDVEVLVGGFGWFSGGHTIILTSRNRQVLVKCNAKEPYEIQKLSARDSLRLCSQFDTEQNWMGRLSLIFELVNYANGNPLALRVLGSSIHNQCINDEQQYLRRLRQHPPIQIQDSFRRSFNGLDDNEKKIFLDLACFFKGENKDRVLDILDGCGTDFGIYALIDESLISLVDNKLEMPDFFQDMGRFVVFEEYKEAGKRSRLWDFNDIVDVLSNNSGTEAIEGISLDMSGLTLELSDLSPTVFERMYRLRLLKLHGLTSENHCKVCLPKGLHSLPDELRLLHWERYPLESLPRNFNPKYLVELNMPYSNIKRLWRGTKNLENLKRIILSHSRQLTKFPKLSKARNLEHIDLEGCVNLVKVNSSILHNHKLTFLSLKDCSHLRVMPPTVDLEYLEVLNLSGCSVLENLQDFSPNLKELYLAGTTIREIPSSIGWLTRLVTFDLENCERLQHLPPEISILKGLITMDFSHKSRFTSVDSASTSVVTDSSYKSFREFGILPERPYQPVQLGSASTSVVTGSSYKSFRDGILPERHYQPFQLGSASTSVVTGSSYKSFRDGILPERHYQPVQLGSASTSVVTDSSYKSFMKTGDDKQGDFCELHHPKDKETHVPESFLSPTRPGERLCASYFRSGNCRLGPICRFDHPRLVSTDMNTSFMASNTPVMHLRGHPLTLVHPSSEIVEESIVSENTPVVIEPVSSTQARDGRYTIDLNQREEYQVIIDNDLNQGEECQEIIYID